jgi:hypothetical protein
MLARFIMRRWWLSVWVGNNLQRELKKKDWAAGEVIIYSVCLALA